VNDRLVVGAQPVREAVRAHHNGVREVVLLAQTPRLNGLRQLCESLNVPVRLADRRTLDQLSFGAQHQGALAYAPELRLHGLPKAAEASLVLALDGVQDPQNFGAAVRSAVGVALAPVLWAESSSAPLTPATFRASAGAIEHARLCRVPSLTQALFEASMDGFQVVGLDAHADRALSDVDLRGPTLLLIGGEGRGLSRGARKACSVLARLVLPHTIDSLNASVSAALALYEAQRQRTLNPLPASTPMND
jgi:23S rRNA (guanosine2251-2'-O)-methyltransferase